MNSSRPRFCWFFPSLRLRVSAREFPPQEPSTDSGERGGSRSPTDGTPLLDPLPALREARKKSRAQNQTSLRETVVQGFNARKSFEGKAFLEKPSQNGTVLWDGTAENCRTMNENQAGRKPGSFLPDFLGSRLTSRQPNSWSLSGRRRNRALSIGFGRPDLLPGRRAPKVGLSIDVDRHNQIAVG
jgi:hypothetical protein